MRAARRLRCAGPSAVAALVLMGLSGIHAAAAAQWYAVPALRMQTGYNDNPRFAISNGKSTEIFDLAPSLEVGARAARWGAAVVGGVHLRRYPGASDLNRNDNSVNVSSHYDGQRLSWRLDGSYVRSSLLGTAQPLGPQTGLIRFQSQRRTGTASPSLTWQVTPTDQLRVSYLFQDTSYQDAARLNLSSFRYHRGSLTYQHDLSARLQVFAVPSYSVFNVPAADFQSRTVGLRLGVTRVFSSTLSATLSAGGRRTESKGVQLVPQGFFVNFLGRPVFIQTGIRRVGVSSLNTGITVDASFTKRLERGALTGSFTRSLTPNGLGTEVETNDLSLALDRPLTRRLTGNLSLHLLRARTVGAIGTTRRSSVDRDYARLSPSLRWQWTRRTTVDLSYAYTWFRYRSSGQIARNNVIYLTLSYRWPRITLSR
jgi:hypothetical protein